MNYATLMFPIGVVLPFAGAVLPQHKDGDTGEPEAVSALYRSGWLPCDGSRYRILEYGPLYKVIRNAFGGGDGYFCVPDMRGRFMRGVSLTSQHDPDANERGCAQKGGNAGNAVGSLQLDAVQRHEHDYQQMTLLVPPAFSVSEGTVGAWGKSPVEPPHGDPTAGIVKAKDAAAAPRTSSETRPANLNFNFIIRYK